MNIGEMCIRDRIKGVNKNFNLSVGSEVELSNNFGGRDGFYVIPKMCIRDRQFLGFLACAACRVLQK